MAESYDVCGRGLCMIYANFVGKIANSAHLKGYCHDVRHLRNFFEGLGFTVRVKKNFTKAQFMKSLSKLPGVVGGEGKYDRVFVFVLSHGCEKGLHMCQEDTAGKRKETDESGQLVCVPVNDIIGSFAAVPSLKGVPKCFFIQACRGNRYMQVASDYSDPTPSTEEDEQANDINHGIAITGADIFVAYSCHEYAKCFVDNKGSLFIYTTLGIMKSSYKMKDVFEIMTEVIGQIAKETESDFLACNNPNYEIKTCPPDKEDLDENYYPCSVQGKPKESSAEYYEMLVRTTSGGDTSYVGFISHDQLTVNLDDHCLSGWVYFKPGKDKCCKLENLSREQLVVFAKHHQSFLVEGEVRRKSIPFNVLSKGKITANDDEISAEGTIIPIGKDEQKTLDLVVCVKEDDTHSTKHPVDKITGCKAKLYIDGELHGCGEFQTDQNDNVCGINADVYQLPCITSTLTKRFHLVTPTTTAVDRQTLDAIMRQNASHDKAILQIVSGENPQPKPSIPDLSRSSLDSGDVEQPLS